MSVRWLLLAMALLTLPLAAAVPIAPTVSIDGPGRGQLVPLGSGFELRLTGTSAFSVVSIITPDKRHVVLTNITTNSAVGTLDLGNADLSGKVIFKFPVGRLTLGEVSHAAIVTPTANAFSFSAGAVTDASVIAPNASATVDVTSWSNGATETSHLEAARLTSLHSAGNFAADVFLSNPGAGFTLERVQIGGAITGGVWSVHGNADSISAASTTAAWRMNISGPLLTFTTTGDASGDLAVAELQQLQVGGSARGLKVLAGADLGDDAALGGSGTAADRFRPGTLAHVRIDGDMIDSSLYSSVDPVNGVFNDDDDVQLGTAAQRLQEFVLGGHFVGASSVVAPAFPTTVSVGGANIDPATLPQFFKNVPGGGDHAPPTLIAFRLAAASDTAPVGDNKTTINPVTLEGTTEAGATLTLRSSASSTVVGTTTAGPDGNFSFNEITLTPGDNDFELSVADAAGNITTGNLRITLEPGTTQDDIAPSVSAELLHDTGSSAHDGITNDPTITGAATDNVGVSQLRAALDPGAQPTFTDISAQLQTSGSFTLARAVLDALAGGHLADGQHTLRLAAGDAAGNVSASFDLTFTLDTVAPTGASFGISAVDALNGDDTQTASAIVTLQGTAEATATITLDAQNLLSTSSGNGNFQLPGVALDLGSTPLSLKVSDTAGNSQTVTRTLTRVQATRNDAVLEWIDTALHAIQLDVTHPQIATRTLAIQSLAVYDTLAAIQGTPAYLVQRTVSGPINAEAAAGQAAYRVLHTYYPGQRASFDALLATRLATIPDSAAKSAGIALGDDIARAIIDIRSNDGYLNFVAHDGSTAPGEWRPTEPLFLVAEEPQWGQVTPFALSSGDQFRAPPPPRLDSTEYAAATNQVQSLGRFNSTTRTADQTQQAQFWADGAGSFSPPGHWNQIAAEIAAARGNSLSANARLMAQLNVALADAAIAAWDTKYTYSFWRPVTAIHNADQDGNAATTQDATWTPLLISPAHPSYVSGHSTFSAAAAGVLNAIFGGSTSFTATSITLPGVTRSYASFSDAANEAGTSRIYGGIHTSLDNDAGKLLGTQVAQTVLARFAQTQDSQPPRVILSDTPNASRTNITLTGQVLDNLSGVASAQISVDNGDVRTLTLDATGHFSFSTTFATNGSADGVHGLAFSARDLAGNVSADVIRTVTLDTQSPSVTLTSILDGDALTTASRLSGGVAANGGDITNLSYRLDDGTTRTLPFDAATGSFDSAIAISTLAEGNHTLRIIARDSADNVSTLTRNVRIDALAPFTLSAVTPSTGSGQVGVTQRPQIIFSRPVNPGTLTANSLFATAPDGSRLAARIVPASDGSFAWLFFNAPMPGGSQITVHVDGGLIRAAADGAFLDADGDGQSGGVRTVSFTTVSSTPVAQTRLVGRVFDPGPDLKPLTFDDVRRGPDGVIHTADDVFLLPVAHAKVFVLGHEERFVFTDANGHFELDGVPSGDVKVAIDGRTASNSPAAVFFPEMVMDTQIQAGVVNRLMGGMGSLEQRLLNADRDEVYLPRVPSNVLQTVSDTQTTVVGVDDPQAASQLTDQQRAALKLTVTPGSAIGSDGAVLTNAQLGISTVPPELVKDMLPPGVLQHTFDITIQAPGVATFSQPPQISFPNVFNSPPGAQLSVLSFDHTTGLLVINGTATVAADGSSVVSDPDSGIRAPGWHGLTPPGGCGGSGGEPPQPVENATSSAFSPRQAVEIVTEHKAVALDLATGSPGMDVTTRPEWIFVAPAKPSGGGNSGSGDDGGGGSGSGCNAPRRPPSPPPAPGQVTPFVNVTLEIDGDLARFAKPANTPNSIPLVSHSFTLAAGSGETKTLSWQGKSYEEMFADAFFTGFKGYQQLGRDQLYGARITLHVIEQRAEGMRTHHIYTYYQYRWVDVMDAFAAAAVPTNTHKDQDTARFMKAIADGRDGFKQVKSVEYDLPNDDLTNFSAARPFNVADETLSGRGIVSWTFDPETAGDFASDIVIRATRNIQEGGKVTDVGILKALGKGAPPRTVIGLDRLGLKAEIVRLLKSLKQVTIGAGDGDPQGLPGLPHVDDDHDGIIDDDSEYGFQGSDDFTGVLYEVEGSHKLRTVLTAGADGRAGKANVDDNNNGVMDDAGELGAPGSDDARIFVAPFGTQPRTDVEITLPPFQNQFRSFMPSQRQAGPDGIKGTVDDEFSPLQLEQMDFLVGATTRTLLPMVKQDYDGILGPAVSIQDETAGADIVVKWQPQVVNKGSPAGGATPLDRSQHLLELLLGTPDRFNPVTKQRYILTVPDVAQQWALAEFLNPLLTEECKVAPSYHMDFTNPTTDYIQILANTASHEIGHALGLTDAYCTEPHCVLGTARVRSDGDAFPYDLMATYGPMDADRSFAYPTPLILQAAVGRALNTSQLQDALVMVRDNFNLPEHKDGLDIEKPIPPTTPEITVVANDISYFGSSGDVLAFGPVGADGSGGATRELTVELHNDGVAPLALDSVHLANNDAFTLVDAPAAGTQIPAHEQLTFTLRFDPLSEGNIEDSLVIESNAGMTPHFALKLQGAGARVAPSARVAITNNNLGGVTSTAPAAQRATVFTLTNDGLQPLVISAASLIEGANSFALVGLTTPTTIAAGEHVSFGASFKPDHLGLQRAVIDLVSNDPNQSHLRLGLVGTGVAAVPTVQWGEDYFAVENPQVAGTPALRAVSDQQGNFGYFLNARTPYHIVGFDPATSLVTHSFGTTAVGGQGTDLTATMVFLASTDRDSDFDGLPDDVEFAIGTAANKKDSDGDGVDDFTEIQQGLDPLGALRLPVRAVMAATALKGSAEAVAAMGSLDGQATLTALVATGSEGLALVDVTQATRPRVLAELDLPGENSDVAVDGTRKLAAVAGGETGLHIVDVSNPAAPVLRQTVQFGNSVSHVVVNDGIAYVTSGRSLFAVDVRTGEIVNTLDLSASGAQTLRDVAIAGNTAFVIDTGGLFISVDVANAVLTPVGSLRLPAFGGELFVADGVAYVGAGNSGAALSGGYLTINVANPAQLTLLSGSNNNAVAGEAIALNGSGLVLAVGGTDLIAAGFRSLDIFNGADPRQTNTLITRVNLPQIPKDLVLASGFAFVADGTSGLQLVNYLAPDVQGVAPVVSIALAANDADPGKPGVQVLEGRTVRIVPTITDDVQVRGVELLANGQVIATDVSFPFDLVARAPSISSAGNQLTLQLRGTDMGGNVALSNTLSVEVVTDTAPPQLVTSNVSEGARLHFVKAINLSFDEPLDSERLTSTAVSLVRDGGTGDDIVIPITLDTRAFGQVISVLSGDFLAPGDYELRVDATQIADIAGNVLAENIVRHFTILPDIGMRAAFGTPAVGNLPSANPGQEIGIAVPFNPSTIRASFNVMDPAGTASQLTINASRWDFAGGIAYFFVPPNAISGDTVFFSQVGTVITNLPDGTIPLQVVPIVRDVQVLSVTANGASAEVTIDGDGFVEGNNSEYRFGTVTLVDTSTSSGPDVQSLGSTSPTGRVRVTLPISDAAFGTVNVKTAGGTSASFSIDLNLVDANATSGTPADATLASANAGQVLTLSGAGLSTNTDVLLRFTSSSGTSGTPTAVLINPTAAANDGRRALLTLPGGVNGVLSLQVLGATNQPRVQIVPTLARADIQSNTVLFGSGLIEGAGTYNFAGTGITDGATDSGNTIDVAGDNLADNRIVTFNRTALPTHGQGNVTVTTAGGTSAPLALNTVRLSLILGNAGLGDVAVDVNNDLWVSDMASPTHLLRINASTGQTLQTITVTSAFGSTTLGNNAGLQILAAPMTLGTTNVPAGSLLVFNGNIGGADQVVAVNTSNGTVIASRTLDAHYGLTAGAFNPANNHLYIADNSVANGRIVELSAATGAQVAAFATPFNVQPSAGLAIDPTTGHLWLGASNGNSLLQEYRVDGTLTLLRTFDTTEQNIDNNEIGGLGFAANGTLWAASTQGELYRIDTTRDGSAVLPATLSQIIAKADFGVAANAALPSAHAGQLIDLIGTRFGAGTRVLFNVRDNSGNTRLVSQTPVSINASGTRLQVTVPDLAATGDVRVVNQGARSLGIGTARDAIYRAVTLDFVANGPTATIRFSDAGLNGSLDTFSAASWGLDNVTVRHGSDLIFADDFESANAAAQWSDATINSAALPGFGRFSGRFNSTAQLLNLSNLTAGQTYTLSFDLLAIDTWVGTNASLGPNVFDVSIDGSNRLHEALANDTAVDSAQTFRASAGIRLQIVPTLVGRIGNGLVGSGFMEGATTVSFGGLLLQDLATNLTFLDVGGARNDTINFNFLPSLDGPIRVTTEGGYAEITGADFGAQPIRAFTGSFAAAFTNQSVTFQGAGLTSDTPIQFQGIDDSGTSSTITVGRPNSFAGDSIAGVFTPSLARTGLVTILGSGVSRPLKIVPTLRAIGGTVAAGNTVMLEGTGLAANDLNISIDGRAVGTFSVRNIINSTTFSQQLVTLVVPAGVGPGVVTVSTSGGSDTLSSGVTDLPPVTTLPSLNRDADVGDTVATAFDTSLALNQSISIQTGLGVEPGQPNTPRDVDLFRVELNAGDALNFKLTPQFVNNGGSAAITRVFTADGTPILGPLAASNSTSQPVSWNAPFSGSFYIGISGGNNPDYDANHSGSGPEAAVVGPYQLEITRTGEVNKHLKSITATATAGTPARSSIPSANMGQTITLSGEGLRADDKLLFTNGLNGFGNTDPVPASFVVTPIVNLANQTLTAVVPGNAVTGSVRLVRDNRGVLLQIVPTLSTVAPTSSGNSFTGGTLRFTGSGFVEDAASILAGNLKYEDIFASDQFDVTGGGTVISLTVPSSFPAGPFSLSTAGGTSALLNVSFTGIDATCSSGTPANGAQACAIAGQAITLQGSGFTNNTFAIFQTIDAAGAIGDLAVKVTSTSNGGTRAQINTPVNALTGPVRVVGASAAVPLQIVATVTDAQVQSVASNGSNAVVLLTGTGFVEGAGSEYRFGTIAITDAGNSGPDVLGNGTVRVTVPLNRGNAFGAITVKTAGGVSAPFTVNLAGINSTAQSGTPADPALSSANAGQTLTLLGTGLSTNTDVMLRFVDINGSLSMLQLSPTSATGDGTSATLPLPAFVNGAFALQVFGSASQPVLQIVPTLTSADIQLSTVLFGSGFVEGSATYNFAGASAVDSAADANTNIDVANDAVDQNRRVNITRTALPRHGLGNVTVSTAGGTSAPFALNTVRANVPQFSASLGDVAVDPASGNLWVSDQASPTHLLRLDANTGDVLQTITLTSAFGSTSVANNVGLQIVSAAMTLGTTNVPAGSLLVFNGNLGGNDRVIAVDPTTGNVITSLTLGARYSLSGGTFNPANGHIYLTETGGAGNRIIEVSTTGSQLGAITAPFSVTGAAGIGIDPTTGHLWVGALNGGAQLLEYRIDDTNSLTLLRTLNATAQNINQNEISGVSFAADGTLWVASTQGEVYRIDTH